MLDYGGYGRIGPYCLDLDLGVTTRKNTKDLICKSLTYGFDIFEIELNFTEFIICQDIVNNKLIKLSSIRPFYLKGKIVIGVAFISIRRWTQP